MGPLKQTNKTKTPQKHNTKLTHREETAGCQQLAGLGGGDFWVLFLFVKEQQSTDTCYNVDTSRKQDAK